MKRQDQLRDWDKDRDKERDRGLSGESTFYNYTLAGRQQFPPVATTAYALLLLLFAAVEIAVAGGRGIGYALLGVPIVWAMHTALTMALLRTTRDSSRGSWAWKLRPLCCGFLPGGFAGLRAQTRLHLHLLAIGVAWAGIAYVWIPLPLFAGILCIHAWVLLPRLYVLYRFRRLGKPGLVKWHDGGASLYIP